MEHHEPNLVRFSLFSDDKIINKKKRLQKEYTSSIIYLPVGKNRGGFFMGNKEQTYQDIMETAFKMFSKKGFDQTSLTNIATEVGISKPAIYYYFKSKDELIKTLFDTLVKDIQSFTLIKVET